jgi:hypothetical protein
VVYQSPAANKSFYKNIMNTSKIHLTFSEACKKSAFAASTPYLDMFLKQNLNKCLGWVVNEQHK